MLLKLAQQGVVIYGVNYKDDAQAANNPFLASIVALQNRDVEVWPENWPIVQMFCRLATQWQVGMGGAVGLRYEAVYPLLDRQYANADDWQQAFSDLQELERAALDAMRDEE